MKKISKINQNKNLKIVFPTKQPQRLPLSGFQININTIFSQVNLNKILIIATYNRMDHRFKRRKIRKWKK
jgi:hypothetical protein